MVNAAHPLLQAARPTCHQDNCEAKVVRIEGRWVLEGDNTWVPGPYWMVCARGHRVLVEPF